MMTNYIRYYFTFADNITGWSFLTFLSGWSFVQAAPAGQFLNYIFHSCVAKYIELMGETRNYKVQSESSFDVQG